MPEPQLKVLPLPFPMGGVIESSSEADQPEGTSPAALNVRGYDIANRRERGCQRVGLGKFVADNQTGEQIDAICPGWMPIGYDPSGGGVALSGGTLT